VERFENSQILFSFKRLWEPSTRASYILTAVTLVLAQPLLGAQTARSYSGAAGGQIGAALPDLPVKAKDVYTAAIETAVAGSYKSTLLSYDDSPVKYIVTGFYPTEIK
jgi:hypothetical protein